MENNITDNLASFIDQISKIPRKKDHTLFFRGHANEGFSALPAIFRSIPKSLPPARYIDKESKLFHNMIMQCPDEFKGSISTFDHLVKMQHYGLPTRLLDITTNPLVALYFACSEFVEEGHDGEVLVYQIPNNEIKFYNSDTVSVISNLAQTNNHFNIENKDDRGRFIHIIKNEKPYFLDEIVKDDLKRVVCVQPKQDNKRIIKQSGAFLLFAMGDGFEKNTSAKIPSDYKLKQSNITIPCKHKDKLLWSLEHLAISEATLFPEIDNVAKFLKKPPSSVIYNFQNDFISNHRYVIEKIINYISKNDDLLEKVSNNPRDIILQSGLLNDHLNQAVIEIMDTYDEEANLLLGDSALFSELAVYCYEQLRNDRYQSGMV